MSTQRIIGIDFGTSTSVVRVKTYVDGVPESSRVFSEAVKFDNEDTLPSLALYDDSYGEYSYGKEADDLAGQVQGELLSNFKLDLLSEDEATRQKTEELIKGFFKHIFEAYSYEKEHFTPCTEETTYVSYPVKWQKEAADTMLKIAMEAGFQNVKGIDEASAAIYTVLIQKEDELKSLGSEAMNILMVDMGAGTTDLALCRYVPGEKNAKIVGTWPTDDTQALFGGHEVDDALWGYLKEYIDKCGIPPITDERPYLSQSKSWKEKNVSPMLAKCRTVTACQFVSSLFVTMGGSHAQFPAIDREKFESIMPDYLRQSPELVNGIFDNTPGVAAGDVDLVILTGGHSQWYFVDEILAGRLAKYGEVDIPKIKADPSRLIRLSRPQETVALGLVYQPMTVKVKKEEPKAAKEEVKIDSKPEPKPKAKPAPEPEQEIDWSGIKVCPKCRSEDVSPIELKDKVSGILLGGVAGGLIYNYKWNYKCNRCGKKFIPK